MGELFKRNWKKLTGVRPDEIALSQEELARLKDIAESSGVTVGGDISGTPSSPVIVGIQGNDIAAGVPTSGEVLTWDGSEWAGATPVVGLGGDLGGDSTTAVVTALQGNSVTPGVPTSGEVLTWNGAEWTGSNDATINLSGDLGGDSSSATVTALQGDPVAASTPTSSGEVLTWDGSQWISSNDVVINLAGDLGGDSTAAIVSALQGNDVAAGVPGSGEALIWDGSQWVSTPIVASSGSLPVGGDLSGTTDTASVIALNGNAVSATSPGSNQVLTWNGSAWAPADPAGGGAGPTASGVATALITTPGVELGNQETFAAISGVSGIMLPSAPNDGQFHWIKDALGTAETAGVVIDGNGKNIDGETTYTITANYEAVNVVYMASFDEWFLV